MQAQSPRGYRGQRGGIVPSPQETPQTIARCWLTEVPEYNSHSSVPPAITETETVVTRGSLALSPTLLNMKSLPGPSQPPLSTPKYLTYGTWPHFFLFFFLCYLIKSRHKSLLNPGKSSPSPEGSPSIPLRPRPSLLFQISSPVSPPCLI